MFFCLKGLSGTISYNGNRLSIGKIDLSAIPVSSITADQIKTLSPMSHNSLAKFTAPRYSEFVVFAKSGDFVLTSDDIQEIESEAISQAAGSWLNEFLRIVKTFKRQADKVDVRKLFTCAHVNGGSLTWENSNLSSGFSVDFTGGRFLVNQKKPSTSAVKGVFIFNEFEAIHIPFDAEHGSRATEILNRISARMNLPGRISTSYMVVPTDHEDRIQIQFKSIKDMKMDDMLTYFGHTKKSSTKVDTLNGCLQALTTRNVPSIKDEVGTRFLIELNHMNCAASPYAFIPVDYILNRGSHFRILSSETVETFNCTRLVVEVTKEPVDDFVQTLYTTMESTDGAEIKVSAFYMDEINRIIGNVSKDATKNK